MDLQKNLMLRYDEKEGEWIDITADVRFYDTVKGYGRSYYKITYSSGDSYNHKYSNIKISTEPKKLNIEDYAFFKNGSQLVNVLQILKFDNWVRVFYNNGDTRAYQESEIAWKEKANKEPKVASLLKYLTDVANYTETKEGILHGQLSELEVFKNSVLYSIINGRKLEPFNTDKNKLIFPFSYNNSQKEAVYQALSNHISLIQGPPGTGKTQTILNIIANLLYKGKTVAVVSANNEATRNVEEKMQAVGLGFLTAFLGNKKNVEKFFEAPHPIPDVCKEWENTKYDLSQLERELTELNSHTNSLLKYQVDVSKIKQLINGLKIEKAVHDAEFTITTNISPKIQKMHFTLEKLLELKAELELLPENKINGFFTKVRFLFKYGVFSTQKHFENRTDTINFLTAKYYEIKLASLQKELAEKQAFIDRYKNLNPVERISRASLEMLKSKICKSYLKDCDRGITKYKFYFNEFLSRFPVVLSTTHALAITSGHGHLYDYVVIDESSQVDLASAAVALSCAKHAVLVGDLMQLPNVIETSKKPLLKTIFGKYNLPRYQDYSNYSILRSVHAQYGGQVPNTLLNEHYRCDPEIIGFCNKRFYNDRLIIRTDHKPGNGVKIKYTESHHARGRVNERQVDIIEQEILPTITGQEIGIVAPYRDQVTLLQERIKITNCLIDTVHKFQGKEKSNIILSTVSNSIKISEDEEFTDFMNDPNLLNVAISRAKNKLFLVISEELMKQPGAILSDFSRYIKYFCEDGKIEKTEVYSVLDLMHKEYSPKLEAFRRKMIRVSQFESENIIATQIKEICDEKKFGVIGFLHNYQLQKLVRAETVIDEDDKKFLLNPNTHCDFVIYDKLDNSPRLVVEVDGMQHKATKQKARDERKDRILKFVGIKIVRILTTSSGCKEKIEIALKSI